MLRQVLFNLVDNALRYCSGGPAALEIRAEPRKGPLAPVCLWVFDDGPGVAPADRESMFEPFFTTPRAGTGLGLYLGTRTRGNGYD